MKQDWWLRSGWDDLHRPQLPPSSCFLIADGVSVEVPTVLMMSQTNHAICPHPGGLPEDIFLPRGHIDALSEVVGQLDLAPENELRAVGGAVEEDVVVAVAPYPVDLPRRVHGGTARRQRNAPPILISIEEQAVDMALKADVRYVEEDLHPGALICGMESWRPKEIDEIEYITTPFR